MRSLTDTPKSCPTGDTDRDKGGATAPTQVSSGMRMTSLGQGGTTRPDATRRGCDDLAFTQYCHYQYCMMYGIHRGGRVGVVYRAFVLQQYCNSVSNAGGGGDKRMID